MKPTNSYESSGRKIINWKFIDSNIASYIAVKGNPMSVGEIQTVMRENRDAKYSLSEIKNALENSKLIRKIGEGNRVRYQLTF